MDLCLQISELRFIYYPSYAQLVSDGDLTAFTSYLEWPDFLTLL